MTRSVVTADAETNLMARASGVGADGRMTGPKRSGHTFLLGSQRVWGIAGALATNARTTGQGQVPPCPVLRGSADCKKEALADVIHR